MGDGPVTFSTSLELMPRFHIPHDTNGYYRELGVSPFATRREIREAYQAKEGWTSIRLTYIVTQLLNPQIRAAYDRTPFGSFFWDDYVDAKLRRERVRDMIWLRKQGMDLEAEVLSDKPLDWSENLSHQASSLEQDDYDDLPEWPWAFYQWGSRIDDPEELSEWQSLLISALGERKEHHQIAVGYSSGRGPWVVRTVGYRVVVFLDDYTQPTEALARAASRVIEQHNTNGRIAVDYNAATT